MKNKFLCNLFRRLARESGCDAPSHMVNATPSSREGTSLLSLSTQGTGDEASPSLSATRASQPLCLAAVFALLFSFVAASAQERPGKVEFSDSNVLSGVISLTPGSQLKIQAGKEVRVLSLDRVAELRFAPEREEMERAWRFKEAGQTAKEFFGDPYPVLYLATTVTLGDGEKISGHLYTTVLYVADGDNVQKVILLAKQRGKENEKFESVLYPKVISFGDAAAKTEATVRLKLSGLPAKSQVVGIPRGALVRLEAKARGANGKFDMPSPLGEKFFLAAKSGTKITVGWPPAPDDKIVSLVRNAMTNSEDFFDDRRVLGAFLDATNSEIYSLVLAARKGKTTLHETRSQPWRLEIYRWKQDDDGRVMLAGHDHFFRGISAKDEALPAVELSEKLWNIHPRGNVWTDSDE